MSHAIIGVRSGHCKRAARPRMGSKVMWPIPCAFSNVASSFDPSGRSDQVEKDGWQSPTRQSRFADGARRRLPRTLSMYPPRRRHLRAAMKLSIRVNVRLANAVSALDRMKLDGFPGHRTAGRRRVHSQRGWIGSGRGLVVCSARLQALAQLELMQVRRW